MLIAEAMLSPEDEFGRPPSVGVLAPTYAKAELVVSKYEDTILSAFGEQYYKINRNKHRVLLPHNGAELTWLSADDPKSVVGFTFSTLITDESQDIPDTVFEKVYPTLDVRNARVFSFGTPDITPEQTWYKANVVRGNDEGWDDYSSFTVTCFDNPWMSAEAIRTAQNMLSEREFRMLYLGEWVDEEGSVFTNWENAVLDTAPEYNPKLRHVMSVDFAVHEDFTVVMVGERSTRTAIHLARWNRTDPMETYDRITDIWETYGKPPVIADGSGLGLPMIAELRERGLRVRPIVITAANKLAMIGRLAANMEHRRIQFPEWEPLTREIRSFLFNRTKSGRLTAQAASGFHDDCITALMLLNEGFRSAGSVTQPTSYLHNGDAKSKIRRFAKI